MKNVKKTKTNTTATTATTTKTLNKVIVKATSKKEIVVAKKSSKIIYSSAFYEGIENDRLAQKKRRGQQRTWLFNKMYRKFILNKHGVRRGTKERKEFEESVECTKLVKDFVREYKHSYSTNDFTVQSLYNGTDDGKREEVTELIAYVYSLYATKKTTTKKTTKKTAKKTKVTA